MAVTILGSPRAIEISVYVVRAFVRLRELAVSHGDLAQRLAELEHKTQALCLQHDSFSRNARTQLKQVFDALRDPMTPPDPPNALNRVRDASGKRQEGGSGCRQGVNLSVGACKTRVPCPIIRVQFL